jgi:hypothetical protein
MPIPFNFIYMFLAEICVLAPCFIPARCSVISLNNVSILSTIDMTESIASRQIDFQLLVHLSWAVNTTRDYLIFEVIRQEGDLD